MMFIAPAHQNGTSIGFKRGFAAFNGSAPPFKHLVAMDCVYNCSSWAIGILDNIVRHTNMPVYCISGDYSFCCILGVQTGWFFLHSIEYRTLPSDLLPKILILWVGCWVLSWHNITSYASMILLLVDCYFLYLPRIDIVWPIIGQSWTRGSLTGGGRSPGFDEMMMMPDAKDRNANPDRFFVSLHWIFENWGDVNYFRRALNDVLTITHSLSPQSI